MPLLIPWVLYYQETFAARGYIGTGPKCPNAPGLHGTNCPCQKLTIGYLKTLGDTSAINGGVSFCSPASQSAMADINPGTELRPLCPHPGGLHCVQHTATICVIMCSMCRILLHPHFGNIYICVVYFHTLFVCCVFKCGLSCGRPGGLTP